MMFFFDNDHPGRWINGPAIMAQKGFKVSLQTDAINGLMLSRFRDMALICVRYGMDRDQALKAVTLTAAEAVGLEDRIGSIEVGKDADLILLNGDPFEYTTSIEKVIIDGKVEYDGSAKIASRPIVANKSRGALELPVNLAGAATFAIRCGTLITIKDTPMKGALVLISGGKIAAVGSKVELPPSCPIVDASEFYVMPGLVDAYSTSLTDSAQRRSPPITPEYNAKADVDVSSPVFENYRALGISTFASMPGVHGSVVSGQGVVVKTADADLATNLIKDRTILSVGIGANSRRNDQMPLSRMGVTALLRQAFVSAVSFSRLDPALSTMQTTESAAQMRALGPFIRGDQTVMISADKVFDVHNALKIVEEFHLRAVIAEAAGAGEMVSEIKRLGVSVVLSGIGTEETNVSDFDPAAAGILARAGVRVSFNIRDTPFFSTKYFTKGAYWVPSIGRFGGDLLEVAASAYKYGMPEADALRAITINAAEILSVDDRVGSIEPGKDADLLILAGHPLTTSGVPEVLFIGGKVAYQRHDGMWTTWPTK